jgi:hypothetical protein
LPVTFQLWGKKIVRLEEGNIINVSRCGGSVPFPVIALEQIQYSRTCPMTAIADVAMGGSYITTVAAVVHYSAHSLYVDIVLLCSHNGDRVQEFTLLLYGTTVLDGSARTRTRTRTRTRRICQPPSLS